MAGRNSSLLTAKMVLLMASANIEADMLTEAPFSTTGIFGKSSAFSPLNLYFPSPALISTARVCISMEKATGWSGRVFSVSIRILDGMATRPSSFDSMANDVTMLVCRSVAEIVRILSLISNRKFSRIGSTVFVLDAPLIACNCFSSNDVETINLMSVISSNYFTCNDKEKNWYSPNEISNLARSGLLFSCLLAHWGKRVYHCPSYRVWANQSIVAPILPLPTKNTGQTHLKLFRHCEAV